MGGKRTRVGTPPSPALAPATGRAVVLIVEDDEPSRHLLRFLVQHAGFVAVEASAPTEAMAALEADRRIALVLTDIRMPGTNDGLTFIQQLSQRWPELPIAAVTAYPGDLALISGALTRPIMVFPKPIEEEAVTRLIRMLEALGRTNGDGAERT